MERFPALRLILRFGRLWALAIAVLVTAGATWLLVSQLGPAGWVTPIAALPFSYFLAKSYVELIQIVVEMVH